MIPEDAMPSWLIAKLDQRMALLEDKVLPSAPLGGAATVVMMPLTTPAEFTQEAMERWERTCDACGKDCKDSGFYTGHCARTRKGVQILLTFGVCEGCRF